MSDSNQRAIACLRSSELFSHVDEATLAEVVTQGERVHLAGGETLMRQGDPGDGLYFVLSGRLRFFAESEYRDPLIGEVGAGETIGEMAMLTEEPRRATVCAVRDAELLKIAKQQFETLVERHPRTMLEMARMIIKRQHRLRAARLPVTPATILVLGTGETVPVARFSEALSRQLAAFGSVAHVTAQRFEEHFGPGSAEQADQGERHGAMTAWLEEQERRHRFVLFQGQPRSGGWNARCLRQADVVLLVEPAGRPPEAGALEASLAQVRRDFTAPRIELVLLHDADTRPSQTASRLQYWKAARHHHIRGMADRDMARLARVVLDRGIAVVLSGGGARGFAHIGALRALAEAGSPIDMIAGCSMGAVIAAQYAAGWDWQTSLERNRALWVDSGGLLDFTIPLIALIAGRKGERLMSKAFGDLHIEDLWTDYFCVTSDLTNARLAIHTRGTLWKAVGASAAVPGIAPPQIFDGDLHCDGGVLDNLPVEPMRMRTRGPILAIDIGAEKELAAPGLDAFPTGWSLFWQKLNPFRESPRLPNILAILERSAVLTSIHRVAEVRRQADLYVRPDVARYKLFDFHALEDIAQRGYEAMLAQLPRWDALTRAERLASPAAEAGGRDSPDG